MNCLSITDAYGPKPPSAAAESKAVGSLWPPTKYLTSLDVATCLSHLDISAEFSLKTRRLGLMWNQVGVCMRVFSPPDYRETEEDW